MDCLIQHGYLLDAVKLLLLLRQAAAAGTKQHGCSSPIVWGFGFGCFGLRWMEGILFVRLLLLFDLVWCLAFLFFFDCKPCRSFRSTATSPRLPSV